MYYNGYIIICIFIGSFIGAFIFQWETLGCGLVGSILPLSRFFMHITDKIKPPMQSIHQRLSRSNSVLWLGV
jgi:hypothetical protein